MCKTLSHFRPGFILTEYILFLKKNFWATLSVLYDLWTTEEGEMKRVKTGDSHHSEEGRGWNMTIHSGWWMTRTAEESEK